MGGSYPRPCGRHLPAGSTERPSKPVAMVVLIVVAVVCFIAGVGASSRWLPELADGPVGGIAYFIVCGLAGAALSALGLNIDATVRSLEGTGSNLDGIETTILADSLISIMRDCGTIAGLALIAYLLAPKGAGEPSS
jgi:hypothetical protein